LSNGLEATIRDLQNHCHEIESLPESGVPGQLRSLVADTLKQVQERLQQDDFHKHGADLNTALTDVRNQTRNAAVELAETQQKSVRNAQQDLQRLSEWSELTQEEQSSCVSELEQLLGEATQDLAGIETLLNREYEITTRSAELKKHIEQLGQERRLERLEEEKQKAKKAGQKKLVRNLKFPSTVTNAEQLAELIRQLQELKSELTVYSEIEVNLTIADEMQGKS
jgi:DNA repair exonuclease SbcCD ATPase subunit